MKAIVKGALLGVALMGLAACGGGDKSSGSGGGGGGGEAPAGENAGGGGAGGGGAKAYSAADHKGSLKGTVKFSGTAPAPVVISVEGDEFCAGAVAGGSMNDPQFTVNADGTLPNVFIYPKDGPHKDYEGYPVPTDFKVEQLNCEYVPHVFGVMEGQKFLVTNDDQTTHNVNVRATRNPAFNKGQAAGDQDEIVFKKKEKAIPFTCDVHSWMSAKCWVMDHPFFATSGADGSFEIKGLPDGEYTFVAWHENEDLFGGAEFKVTISGGEVVQDVTLAGK